MWQALWHWLQTPWSGAEIHVIASRVSWHGRGMVLAWSVLLPLGVLCARFFKVWPGQNWPQVLDNKTWWHAHQALQYGGIAIMLVGLWLIQGHAQQASPGALWHARLGWVVVFLGLAQALSGILRGSKGGPTEARMRGDHYDMTAWRVAFERWHKSAGYLAVLAAIMSTFLGLRVADAPHWMFLCIALWWLAMVAAFSILQKQGRCMDTWQAIWGEGKQHKVVGFGIRQYSAQEWQEKFPTHQERHGMTNTTPRESTPATSRGLHLQQVVKRFGDATVVEQLNLHIDQGEFMVLLGESGCGKSTTLRMIAGLEEVSGGHIFLDGRDITHATPRERNIAMVFQSYALYPHMSVAQNMSFALQLAGRSRQEIHARVQEAAKILHIEHLLERKPRDLSGGQRQRVAIGRAIVREPGVFLFDEPLSNLDAKLRGHMRSELALLHRRLGKTTVYVTHDQVEAMTLASRIAIFDKGRIQQIATPQEIFQHPANVFVAGFIGTPGMNFFPVKYLPEQNLLQGDGFSWPAPDWLRARTAPVPEALSLGLRPQALQACAQEEAGLSMQVDVVEYLGNESQVMGHIAGGHNVCATLAGNAHSLLQNRLHLRFEPQDLQIFDRASGQNLRQIS